MRTDIWNFDYVIVSDIWDGHCKKSRTVFNDYEDFAKEIKHLIEYGPIYNTSMRMPHDEIPNKAIQNCLKEMYPNNPVIVTNSKMVFSFDDKEDKPNEHIQA